MVKGVPQTNADGSVTTITSVTVNYLYEEEYQPWFVWTLILAPCLLPMVWYVRIRQGWLAYLSIVLLRIEKEHTHTHTHTHKQIARLCEAQYLCLATKYQLAN
jgi:hypothetical protein